MSSVSSRTLSCLMPEFFSADHRLEWNLDRVIKHEEFFKHQLEKISLYYCQMQKSLVDQANKLSHHPLIRKIDQWEQKSIQQIQQLAKNLREEFKEAFSKQLTQISDLSVKLNEQLDQIRQNHRNDEKEIQQWLNQLDQLKKEFHPPKTFRIEYETSFNPFINRIKLSPMSFDTFDQAVGDIGTIDSRLTIQHGSSMGDATIRGENEYSSGIHQFRFHIEQLTIPKWIFFGIVSKNTPLQGSLHKTRTVYGWAGHEQVWLNGTHQHRYDDYHGELDVDQIIELTLDCDQQRIHFHNQTTSMSHEINVSITRCPFPWVLYIGLYGADDRVRLLCQ